MRLYGAAAGLSSPRAWSPIPSAAPDAIDVAIKDRRLISCFPHPQSGELRPGKLTLSACLEQLFSVLRVISETDATPGCRAG
jgi:hypothetical protein